MYQVEFAHDKVMELTNNIIAEPMYAQCDTDRNEHLCIDLLIDWKKYNKVISLIDVDQ